MSEDPFVLNADGQHINVRLVRSVFLAVQRAHYGNPEWAQGSVAQRIAWLNSYEKFTVLETRDLAEPPANPEMARMPELTIGGIPLRVDKTVPDDTIEFYRGVQLVGKITKLAKPPGL